MFNGAAVATVSIEPIGAATTNAGNTLVGMSLAPPPP